MNTTEDRNWKYGSPLFWIILGAFIFIICIAEPDSIPYRIAGGISGGIFGALGAVLGGLTKLIFHSVSRTSFVKVGLISGVLFGLAVEESTKYLGNYFYDNVAKPRIKDL